MAFNLEHIEDTPHILDILIEIDTVFESLDLYAFKNWINGEIVDGPRIKRYWIDITLQYPLNQMPDPKAGLRLLKHGIMVSFKKGSLTQDSKDTDIWLVTVEIPRKLITGMQSATFDFYDDEVDTESVDDAMDMGIDTSTGYE